MLARISSLNASNPCWPSLIRFRHIVLFTEFGTVTTASTALATIPSVRCKAPTFSRPPMAMDLLRRSVSPSLSFQ
jgi:hypothetical protein